MSSRRHNLIGGSGAGYGVYDRKANACRPDLLKALIPENETD